MNSKFLVVGVLALVLGASIFALNQQQRTSSTSFASSGTQPPMKYFTVPNGNFQAWSTGPSNDGCHRNDLDSWNYSNSGGCVLKKTIASGSNYNTVALIEPTNMTEGFTITSDPFKITPNKNYNTMFNYSIKARLEDTPSGTYEPAMFGLKDGSGNILCQKEAHVKVQWKQFDASCELPKNKPLQLQVFITAHEIQYFDNFGLSQQPPNLLP